MPFVLTALHSADMSLNEITAELFCQVPCVHGESPSWSQTEQALYWVDIEPGVVHRVRYESRMHEFLRLDPPVSFVSADTPVLLTSGSCVFEADLTSGIITPLSCMPIDRSKLRFNDGKRDPQGRLWLGTMALDEKTPAAALYRLDGTGFKVMLAEVIVSNGLAWSNDTFYFIDSGARTVSAFEFDPNSGSIDTFSRRPVVEIQKEEGTPDGMTIDSDGNLWIALLEGGRVSCYEPRTGKEITRVTVPAAKATACCFGGEKLGELFITTMQAEDTRSQPPESGSVFVAKTGARGVPATSSVERNG